MKTIIATLIITCISFLSFAQKKCSIVGTYPVYRVWLPGTMPIDENGNKIKPTLNIERSIYITSSCATTPTFSNIFYDKIAVRFSVTKANEEEATSQIDVKGNKIKFVQPKGSIIWKIDILTPTGKSIAEKPKTIKLLQIENKKTTTILVKKETELMTIPSY